MDDSFNSSTGGPAVRQGAVGTAPPLPMLIVGREKALQDLRVRLGITYGVNLNGERVASFRKLRGLTQKELAHKAGLSSHRTIEEIEAGRNTSHHARTLEGVAKALEVDLRDLQRAVSMQTLTAVHGWPGVGKTTVAAALTADAEITTTYPDGVLWTALGQTPDVLSRLVAWGFALGTDDLLRVRAVEEARDRLASLLREKQMFLVVDDVWKPEHAAPFMIGGPHCATLITTRLASVAQALAPTATAIYKLDVLGSEDAMKLIGQLAPTSVKEYPHECRQLVHELEGLPLALQVAGRLLNVEASQGWNIGNLLRELQQERTQILESPPPPDMADVMNQTTPSVTAILRKSTDRLDPEFRERFAYLGAFAPKPATFNVDALRGVWKVDMSVAKRTVKELVGRGLLEPSGSGRFRMHSLLVAHAEALCEE